MQSYSNVAEKQIKIRVFFIFRTKEFLVNRKFNLILHTIIFDFLRKYKSCHL
jgi:hypothetical protein